MWYGFRPYVSVAQRRANAAREVAKRRKQGEIITPVVIEGRTIAHTFWGQAWCDNLESYSDFANRLPRGRTYARNGSVVDLQIGPGKVTALVSGSELYEVTIKITPLQQAHWQTAKSRCAGQIGSLVELLQGKLSRSVMDIVTAREDGLFPKPREIKMQCSCLDWAGMCKHVAAALYGVGARLDHQPELLFVLRQVDHLELISEVVPRARVGKAAATRKKTLAESEVAGVFGIELAEPEVVNSLPAPPEQIASLRPRAQKLPVPRKVKKPGRSRVASATSAAKPAKRQHAGKSKKVRARS
jgi:uncharacterized Zn finger protein